jgi:hypothetical protein
MTTFRNLFLCAAALAAVSITGPAQAATETVDGVKWTYTVSGGKASVGGGDITPAVPKSTAGAITVPSLLGGCPVTSIGDWAFCGCSNLVSVTIPGTVTTIGTRSFLQCFSLASMTIPNSVTNIGVSAFAECHRLASLTIPANVASIGRVAFLACLGMQRFDVAAGNAHYASEGGILFTKAKDELVAYPCGKTGDYAIPAGVASIWAGAFYGCTNLTSLTMSDSVTNIEDYAFWFCTNLASVTIPASVKSIGLYAFEDTALGTVYVSTGDTERVRGLFVSSHEDISGIQFVEPGDPLTVWRFYSKKYKGHFYTIDEKEKNDLIAKNPNWNFEDGAYRAYTNKAAGTVALHRFYSKKYRGHFYTIDESEKNDLIANNPNWNYEGVAYYVYPGAVSGTVPVYRFWSKKYKHHFYTTDEEEKNDLVAKNPNWVFEKIAFYALPMGGTGAKGKAAKETEAVSQAGRLRPGTGVAVTTSDGTDGVAAVDGDEGTAWSPEEAGASWVVLSFADAREVADVEVVGENLPEGTRILLSEDADEWTEEVPGVARYVWVAFPAAEEAPVVREIRVLEE